MAKCNVVGPRRRFVILSSADSCRNIHIYAGYIPTQWITDAGRLLYKYIYLSLYSRVRKRVSQSLRVRGNWRSNITEIFWPQSYGRQRCVFLVLQGCSTGGPGVHSAGWWLSLLHTISIFSGPQFIRVPSPFGLVWLSLPHLVSNCSATQLAPELNWAM